MEITDVRVRVFQFPPTSVKLIPQTNGTLRSVPGAARTRRIVEITTDEGNTGICPCDLNLQYWEDRVRDLLLGEDPGLIEYLWMKLFAATP